MSSIGNGITSFSRDAMCMPLLNVTYPSSQSKMKVEETKTLESEAWLLRLQNRIVFPALAFGVKYELDRLHTSLPVIFWLGYLLRRGEKHIILSALVMSCLYLRRLSLSVGGAEQSLSQSGPIEAPVHQILDVPRTLLASRGQDSLTFIKNTAGISCAHANKTETSEYRTFTRCRNLHNKQWKCCFLKKI